MPFICLKHGFSGLTNLLSITSKLNFEDFGRAGTVAFGGTVKTGAGGRRVVWLLVEPRSNGNLASCWHRTDRTSLPQASPCCRRPGGSSESSPAHCLACVQLPSLDDLSSEFVKTFLIEQVAM